MSQKTGRRLSGAFNDTYITQHKWETEFSVFMNKKMFILMKMSMTIKTGRFNDFYI